MAPNPALDWTIVQEPGGLKLEHEVCGWTWAYPPVHRFKLTEMVAATTMHVMFECTGARPC